MLAGIHRIQRIPAGSSKRHTSSMTIAVLPEGYSPALELSEDDLEEQFYRGSGRGGQRRNKVSTAVRIVHKPTGMEVHTERGRRQADNRKKVRDRLAGQLEELSKKSQAEEAQKIRRDQIVKDENTKVFTHNEQRSTVSGDGHSWPWKRFYAGRFGA